MPRRADHRPNEAELALQAGANMVADHPLFAPLWQRALLVKPPRSACPPEAWVLVTTSGELHASPRRAQPAEWAHVLAHALLHLGFEHFKQRDDERAWNAACDCVVAQFLAGLKLGKPPEDLRLVDTPPSRDVGQLYELFTREGIPARFSGLGTGGTSVDMRHVEDRAPSWYRRQMLSWPQLLQRGIQDAVTQAVRVAGGEIATLADHRSNRSPAARARAWFMSSFPLLGALAESFKIIEDLATCRTLEISVAAVSAQARTIYINPGAALGEQELRFVMAHEMLHVGLRHDARQCGRDPFLWNVACDYVINQWLIEMGVGAMPALGGLYDPELKGLSAEAVYDRIASDLRRCRKLMTLRGVGLGDMIPGAPGWWRHGDGIALDEFYRSCLARGLVYHQHNGRGDLPGSLVEEILAIQHPAIPWDVELARWFDAHFRPIERRRTYARASRRQSATPDIPRPNWYTPEHTVKGRTFGVVVDTSGSMPTRMLGMALGAIASYAASREVPRVRVVFCDTIAYDAGYMAPEEIAGRVKVRGRGGTILRPGIELLERSADFPTDGPILVITDAQCDQFQVKREHAFLLPEGRQLPFAPRGPVFRLSE